MVSPVNLYNPNGMRYTSAMGMPSSAPYPYSMNRYSPYAASPSWNPGLSATQTQADYPIGQTGQRASSPLTSALSLFPAMAVSSSSPALSPFKFKKKSPIDRKQDRKVLGKLTLITTGLSFVGSSLLAIGWALIEGQVDRVLLVPPLTVIGSLMGVLTGLIYNHID